MNHAALSRPLFLLGRVVAIPGAMELMSRTETNAFSLLGRHQRGDSGSVCEADKKANADASLHGSRILSAYPLGAKQDTVWVITEWDCSATTILRPDEY
jgi:hypothetical protein